MKVEVSKVDKLKRILKISVGGEKFSKAKSEFYAQAAKDIKVAGFRKGAAPLDIIEKNYGKSLKEEFANQYVSQYYSEALKEANISPAGMPKIDNVEIDDISINFSAQVEVRPELELTEDVYKGIVVKEPFSQVEDKEIDKVIDGIKEGLKKATDKDVEGDSLAHWSGHSDLASLKESIKAELLMEKLRQRRLKIDELVAKHLLNAVALDLPEAEVERYHHELVHRQMHQLENRGISADDLAKYKKEIEEKLKGRAQEEVKLFYILKAIAAKENLKMEENANLGEIVLGFVLSLAKYN